MEEGGHYYTVYFTSLAVGFSEDVAYQHAVLAQMPDEVSWLDAANLHVKECLDQKETDMLNRQRLIPLQWRYVVQYGLHSLPGRQLSDATQRSSYQRRITGEKLLAESPVSLKFGLLLHRLGDTYAHSIMGKETHMYTVTETDKCLLTNYGNSFGHGLHMHDPDYPFLRKDLFFSYLQQLHNLLSRKVGESGSEAYRSTRQAKPYHDIRGIFVEVFHRLEQRIKVYDARMNAMVGQGAAMAGSYHIPRSYVNKETRANWLIEEIRRASSRELGVEMRQYSPEKEEGMPLAEFLRRHPELRSLGINDGNVSTAVRSMLPGGYNAATSGVHEAASEIYGKGITDFTGIVP